MTSVDKKPREHIDRGVEREGCASIDSRLTIK